MGCAHNIIFIAHPHVNEIPNPAVNLIKPIIYAVHHLLYYINFSELFALLHAAHPFVASTLDLALPSAYNCSTEVLTMFGWKSFVQETQKRYGVRRVTLNELHALLSELQQRYGGDVSFNAAPFGKGSIVVKDTPRGEGFRWRADEDAVYFTVFVEPADYPIATEARVLVFPDVYHLDWSVAVVHPYIHTELFSAVCAAFPDYKYDFTIPTPEPVVMLNDPLIYYVEFVPNDYLSHLDDDDLMEINSCLRVVPLFISEARKLVNELHEHVEALAKSAQRMVEAAGS